MNLHGGLKGAVVFWHDQWDVSSFFSTPWTIAHIGVALQHVFYQNSFDFGGACYNSLSDTSRREDSFYNASSAATTGLTLPIRHESTRAFYSKWERKEDVPDDAQNVVPPNIRANDFNRQVASDESSRLYKRDTIPYLPGSLFCPAETSDLDQTTSSGGSWLLWLCPNKPNGPIVPSQRIALATAMRTWIQQTS